MAEYICPWCSYPLLCHVRFGKPYWLCIHCNQEIPYGFSSTITKHNRFGEILKRYNLISEHTHDIILFIQLNGRITEANNAALKAYGYEREELLSLNIQNLQIPALQANIADQIEQAENQRIIFETLHRRKDGSTFPVEVCAQGMGVGEERIILSIIRDISQRKQIEQLLGQQLQRERLLLNVQDRIHQSLSLKEILNSTIEEIRQFLQADRVTIHRFFSDCKGAALVESVRPELPSLLGFVIHDPLILEKNYQDEYQRGEIRAIADIRHAGFDQRMIQLLTFFKVKARLAVPILYRSLELEGNQTAQSQSQGDLWGLLIVHQCSEVRQWQQSEIDLLKGLATQIAIAIQHSALNEQLQEARQKLQQITSIDGLTLVANRRRFEEQLATTWQEMAQEKAPLSLIIGNIDFFKRYNDSYGYQAGDYCLKQIASAIRSAVNRPSQLVARYSGGEFAAILPKMEAEAAMRVVEEIRFRIKALDLSHPSSPSSKYVTLSWGIASAFPLTDSYPHHLLVNAKKALAQAKKNRRFSESSGHTAVVKLPFNSRIIVAGESVSEKLDSNETPTQLNLLMSYVAYYLSRGKSIISPLNGILPFKGLVYEYWGYHRDFQEFWQRLQQRRDFRELSLEGDVDGFGNFLLGRCTVGECARCNLPIPVSEGSAYTVPNCTLCNHLGAEKSKETQPWQSRANAFQKTRVVAVGTPPTDERNLRKLFALNGFEVTFLSHPQDASSRMLPNEVDLVLIYAEVSEVEGKVWAEELRRSPLFQDVPIVGLSPEAKFSLPWAERNLGFEEYILSPLGGEQLANHLRKVYPIQSSTSTELYWFPR